MQALKVFRDKAKGVSDLLPWAALIESGRILCKDGQILGGFFYKGKDTASSTPDEQNYISSVVNRALSRLDSNWTLFQDAVRVPSSEYPAAERSCFPDTITQLIEAENRHKFETEGLHFETYYVLILCYIPPLTRDSKVIDLMYETEPDKEETLADKHLAYFEKTMANLIDALSGAFQITPMGNYTHIDPFNRTHSRDELINYLNFALTGLLHPLNNPPIPMYLDNYLGGQELWVGDMPKIGNHYVCCVSLEGFPIESYPNIMQTLEHLPVAYRWSNRMIMLDQQESVGELKKKRRKWKQRERGFLAQVFKIAGGMVDMDAVSMTQETESAIHDSSSGHVAFGYYTSVIVLTGPSKKTLLENARLIVREVQRDGFNCRVETINTMDAWLGTLPGNLYPNVRRTLIHTLNLADLLPLSSVWPGHETCPNPLYPPQSPPLLYGATSGATPFRLNLHVGDVGHTLVFGPTGAGKSTLLATIIAQFRRYPDASIFAFDKGNSLWALTHAVRGQHYEIASDQTLHFTPLSVLESDSDMAWAEEWVATCYQLQSGFAPNPTQREAIHKAMVLHRDASGPDHRSLTDFLSTLQDEALRSALSYYTLDGSLGALLDSASDGLQTGSLVVLEIEELMAMGDKAAIPVLLYLFRRFEKSLKGQPALLVLDEAWVMLGHPVFREKIREWLKVLRKANCAVVLATQSLSDAVKSSIFDVLIESCPTKILLPNEEADKGGTDQHPGPRDLYTIMGLNEAQIDILKTAIKKRHYYYLSPEGRRLFELNLGPVALSFVAVSDKETLSHLRKLKDIYGVEWPMKWLNEKGVHYDSLVG